MKYQLVKLGKLCKIQSGGTPRRGIDGFYGGNIPWAKIGDIENAENGYLFKTAETVTEAGLRSINNKIFPKNTVFLAMYGSVGKTSIAGLEMTTNQAILGLQPTNPDILCFYYLKYWLDCSKDTLLKKARGVALQNISATIVKDFEIPLPPLKEQKSIVKILDAADALRQKRRQAITLLDDYLKSVFLEMFGDPVTNTKKIKTYKGSDLFKFSSGKFNPTKNLSDDFKYPTYGGNGITGYSKDYLIDYDTLVIGRVGAYCGCVHKTKGKIWITDNAIFVKDFKQEVNLEFMNFQFKFLKFNKFADFSGQPKITQKPLEKIEYLVPPLEVQKRFDEIVKKTESLKQKMIVQSEKLETQFQALMQKAFQGDL